MPLQYFDPTNGVATCPAMASGCTVLVGTGTTGGAAKNAPHTANRAHDKLHLHSADGRNFRRHFQNSRFGMIPPMRQELRARPTMISHGRDVLVGT